MSDKADMADNIREAEILLAMESDLKAAFDVERGSLPTANYAMSNYTAQRPQVWLRAPTRRCTFTHGLICGVVFALASGAVLWSVS